MKADVFHAYLSLLKQTRPAQSWLADPDAMEQGETPLTMLQSQVRLAASRCLDVFSHDGWRPSVILTGQINETE